MKLIFLIHCDHILLASLGEHFSPLFRFASEDAATEHEESCKADDMQRNNINKIFSQSLSSAFRFQSHCLKFNLKRTRTRSQVDTKSSSIGCAMATVRIIPFPFVFHSIRISTSAASLQCQMKTTWLRLNLIRWEKAKWFIAFHFISRSEWYHKVLKQTAWTARSLRRAILRSEVELMLAVSMRMREGELEAH